MSSASVAVNASVVASAVGWASVNGHATIAGRKDCPLTASAYQRDVGDEPIAEGIDEVAVHDQRAVRGHQTPQRPHADPVVDVVDVGTGGGKAVATS